MNGDGLTKAADLAMVNCLGAREGEDVLVVTDMEDATIPETLVAAALRIGAQAQILRYPKRQFANQEPPKPTAAAMREADAVFTVETLTISYTQAVQGAREAGARVLGMPNNMDVPTLVRLCEGLDMDELVGVCETVAAKMTNGRKVHLTSSIGTDFTFDLGEYAGWALTGIVRKPGERDWFPPGNTGCGGVENSGNGILVVNGTIGRIPTAPLSQPVRLTVENGYIVKMEGGREADELSSYFMQFEKHDLYRNCMHVSTLGIGTHPTARLTGRVLEDERISGCVHFCVGKSTLQIDPNGRRGTVEAPSHVDMCIIGSTLTLDGETIVDAGRLAARA
jgi:leucyl aminopeptidase (aminopeptidase T)